MVVAFLSDAFAHDELLVKRLASCAILGMAAPVSVGISLLSRRTSCQFVDSNTGGQSEKVEVVKTASSSWGQGIFKCTVGKVSVCKKKVSDRPTG